MFDVRGCRYRLGEIQLDIYADVLHFFIRGMQRVVPPFPAITTYF